MEQTALLVTIQKQLELLQNQITLLQGTIETLTEQNRRKDEEIERLHQVILNLQRAQFGQKSEKRVYVLDDGNAQTSLFDLFSQEAVQPALPQLTPEPDIQVAGHSRKKKRTLEELCANLPVEEQISEFSAEEMHLPNGHTLTCIGTQYIRSELVMEPARMKIVKHYCKVYADREIEKETGCAAIFQAKCPAPLFQHSYASPSVVSDVLLKKYVDAMPLYRQEQMWKRMGVALRRSTLANWVIQTADSYLRPFWKKIREELLKQPVIHADETVLQVLREKGKPAASESRMWVYASSKWADIQLRCFEYHDSRSGDCAKEFLGDFSGVLVSDGYSGYNKIQNAVRAGCWAHTRRKWYEAMPKGADASNSKAAQGYEYCNRLFALEKEFADLSCEERLKRRQKQSGPLLDEYWAWLETIVQPTGKLKDAVTYAVNQKPYLCAFLEHGEIEISNNQVENAIRPFVVGRKGWLFSDTPQGAEASAIVYSLMETAKANGLNLNTYLFHVLSTLPERFEKIREADIHDLLPWSNELKARFPAP